ncbi:MAG TPA: YciI family protein [Candidatus Bathyarchaeia archaeon]|nr:YciI family protein [Candidatus Bathyarchaeia archaeon]
MGFFLYKLIAPRITFAQDMTGAEAQVMKVHGEYWSDLAERRVAVVFGPVLDPKGAWGLAIVEAKDEAEVCAIGAEDPAIKSQFGLKFEVYPMLRATMRREQT